MAQGLIGLSCFEACVIFLKQDQGSNPCSMPWQVHSYPLYCQGSPKHIFEEAEKEAVHHLWLGGASGMMRMLTENGVEMLLSTPGSDCLGRL